MDACYTALYNTNQKPALLRVIDNYADKFVPISRDPKYPQSLSYLYDPKTLDYGYLELLEECERVYSSMQVKLITSKQDKCACQNSLYIKKNNK